jgi:hypothetical protein
LFLSPKNSFMRKQNLFALSILLTGSLLYSSCKKEATHDEQLPQEQQTTLNSTSRGNGNSAYNLEVVLHGEGSSNGHIHFRQDRDAAKIITLDTKVHHLEPNHEYLLQRAVDTNLDGDCTGTNWLTLGLGLQPQSILTDDKGNGSEELWRDVSALASGTTFDIHFRVVDKLTMAVVLNSDCHQYTVR